MNIKEKCPECGKEIEYQEVAVGEYDAIGHTIGGGDCRRRRIRNAKKKRSMSMKESLSMERHGCEFEKYEHHGKEVFVKSHLKGKHREHCLCYACAFGPLEDKVGSSNCPIANAVYKNCTEFGIVSPVWECPDFREE